MATSARLGLPMLVPGQISKEFTHNEALARLDYLVAAAVVEIGRNDPPSSPVPGDCYVVGDAPTDAWDGQAHGLANYTESGWRFASGIAGMSVLDQVTGCVALYDGTQWNIGDVRAERVTIGGNRVLGAQQPAIADHSSDGTINAILAALRAHGLIAAV